MLYRFTHFFALVTVNVADFLRNTSLIYNMKKVERTLESLYSLFFNMCMIISFTKRILNFWESSFYQRTSGRIWILTEDLILLEYKSCFFFSDSSQHILKSNLHCGKVWRFTELYIQSLRYVKHPLCSNWIKIFFLFSSLLTLFLASTDWNYYRIHTSEILPNSRGCSE